MKCWNLLCVVILMMTSMTACVTKQDSNFGGVLGNSYSSEMQPINASSFQITVRKNVTGDIAEINIPGTTVANAFEQVKAVSLLRAAIESHHLGYKYFSVSGTRSQTNIKEKRSASKDTGGGIPEKAFMLSYAHYTTDVELVLELTIQLTNQVSTGNPNDYVDVDQLLKAAGVISR